MPIVPYESLSDEDLMAGHVSLTQRRKEIDEHRSAIEMEVGRRLQERDANALASEKFIAELKPGTPTYDLFRMEPLLKMLPKVDIEKAYTPATTTPVPEKWDGTQVKVLERRGGDIAKVIADARVPGQLKLVIRER